MFGLSFPDLAVLTLMFFGFAYVVGLSKISAPARDWAHEYANRNEFRWQGAVLSFFLALIECPACLGWWQGLAFGLGAGFGWRAILSGFYVSASNLLLYRWINWGED